MKTNWIKHKDYLGSVEFDIKNGILYGSILFINDIVTYEGITLDELTSAFKESVVDYLQTCEELGREPQKAHSGSLNIRIGEETHRNAAMLAYRGGKKLNEFIKEAIVEKVARLQEDKTPTQINVTVQKIYSMETESESEKKNTPGEYSIVPTLGNPSGKNRETVN